MGLNKKQRIMQNFVNIYFIQTPVTKQKAVCKKVLCIISKKKLNHHSFY